MNTSADTIGPHAPGWYLDETAGAWRWWDGRAWTNATRGRADCPYRLDNHGDITCVSRATYERERSGEARGLAAVLCGFFAVHLAGSAGEVNRRRREGPTPSQLIP